MTAAEKRVNIKTALQLIRKLQAKYTLQELQYKTIGAPEAAIKANARRRELTAEAYRMLLQVDAKYQLQAARERGKRKYMHFIINRV